MGAAASAPASNLAASAASSVEVKMVYSVLAIILSLFFLF